MTKQDHKLSRNCRPRNMLFAVAFAGVIAFAGQAEARDGIWTIQCAELAGSQAMESANQLGETLKLTPGIRAKDVFVMKGSDKITRLYYGRYKRRTDKKTQKRSMPKKMRNDMNALRELVDQAGRRYFMRCIAVRYPVADVGNAEWSLSRVRGVYTLQVAVFEPTDKFVEYKKGAAEFCKMLRKRGFEAYYHHTEVSSMVTVGVFGADAVRRGRTGPNIYSREVAELQKHELLKHNLTNGAILRVRNDARDLIAVPSYLVKIPDPSDSGSP